MDTQYKKIEKEVRYAKVGNMTLVNITSYMIFSTLTAPFTVLGVTLQLSSKKLENYYEKATTTEISKIELAKSYDMAIKEKRYNELQLSSGMVGRNKPFRPPYYANYRQAALALTAQGYQGFFKGNLTENFRFASTAFPRYYILTHPYYRDMPPFMRFLAVFAMDTFGELITQPLRNSQTRFILQNRIPEFRVYRNLYKLFEFVSIKELFQGYEVILPRKVMFAFSMAFLNNDIITNFGVLLAFFTFSYPLDTVQRRLEAQSTEHSMLPRRYINGIR